MTLIDRLSKLDAPDREVDAEIAAAEARKKVRSTYLDRGWELGEIFGDPSGRNQTVIERLARRYYRQARRTALQERGK